MIVRAHQALLATPQIDSLSSSSSQSILQMEMVQCRMRSLKFQCHANVEIALVARIRLARNLSSQRFVSTNGNWIRQVEYSLFPMRILGKGSRREAERFVNLSEGTFKVRHQSVNVIVALCLKGKRRRKGQVVYRAGENVQLQNGNGIRHNGLYAWQKNNGM